MLLFSPVYFDLCQIFPMCCLLTLVYITGLITDIFNCLSCVKVINLLLLQMFAAILMHSPRGALWREECL